MKRPRQGIRDVAETWTWLGIPLFLDETGDGHYLPLVVAYAQGMPCCRCYHVFTCSSTKDKSRNDKHSTLFGFGEAYHITERLRAAVVLNVGEYGRHAGYALAIESTAIVKHNWVGGQILVIHNLLLFLEVVGANLCKARAVGLYFLFLSHPLKRELRASLLVVKNSISLSSTIRLPLSFFQSLTGTHHVKEFLP